MKNNCRVYVVDDDIAVRESLKWSLNSFGYQSESFSSAVDFLAGYNPLLPGCLIVDVRMPHISGLELQQNILARRQSHHFPLPIIFITGHGDVQMAVKTLKNGAVDFIEKPFKNDDLFAIIDLFFEKAEKEWIKNKNTLQHEKLLDTLTPREKEVLQKIVLGYLNKNIAIDLGISVKTVEAHRAHVMAKLGVRSVADAVKIFLDSNQVDS